MGLLLDDYPNALCCYSNALRRTGHSAGILQAKESGGGTTQEIGVDANNRVDTAAIAAHAGANASIAKVVRDQSLNAYDVTHPTDSWCPQIYDGSVSPVFAGLSQLLGWDFRLGSTMGLRNAGGLGALALSSYTVYAVINYDTTTNQLVFKYILDIQTTRLVFFAKGTSNNRISIWQGGSDKVTHHQTSDGEIVIAWRVDGANSAIFVDGTKVATGTVNQSAISAGANLGICGPNDGTTINNGPEMLVSDVIAWPDAHDDATVGDITALLSTAPATSGGGGGADGVLTDTLTDVLKGPLN